MKKSELRQIIREELLNEAKTKTMTVSELMSILKAQKAKNSDLIEVRGTLSLPKSGNFIILSTERQM